MRAPARQYDACGEFVLVSRLFDLLDREIDDILHAGFDDRGQILARNLLGRLRAQAGRGDELVGLGLLAHRPAVTSLEALDVLLEYSVGADILIDHVTAHRNDPDMADDILLVDGHVGRAAPDVDHGDALLLFVLGKHRLGRSHGIQEQAPRSDSCLLYTSRCV